MRQQIKLTELQNLQIEHSTIKKNTNLQTINRNKEKESKYLYDSWSIKNNYPKAFFIWGGSSQLTSEVALSSVANTDLISQYMLL